VQESAVDSDAATEVAAFVATHPAATAYAMPEWLLALRRFLGSKVWYLVARLDGQIVGVLPVAERPARVRAALVSAVAPRVRESLGHDCYGGPLVAPGLDQGAADRVLDVLVQSFVVARAPLTTLFPPTWHDLPTVWRRLETVHAFRPMHGYPSAVKPLAGLTPTTVAATYHKKTRNAVVAAKNRGVVAARSHSVGDLVEFWDLLEETMAHGGIATKFPKDFVIEGGRAVIAAGRGDLWLARVDDIPVAGVFVLRAAKTTCWWLGAAARDEKALQHRPMNAVIHAAIVDAVARGDDYFEMGGLTVEGVRAFKLRWGVREYEQVTFERSYLGLADRARALREFASTARARVRRAIR
jgi:hypothetical protein